MKTFLKVIAIVLAVAAAIFFIPRFILQNGIKNMPDAKPAVDISDLSLQEESTYEYEQGDVIVQLPTYYKIREVRELSSIVCEAHTKNKELILIYEPFEQVADKIMPGFSDEYKKLMAEYEAAKPPFPLNTLVEEEYDLFNVIWGIYSADKNDYNFWNLTDTMMLGYRLTARMEADKTGMSFNYFYQRDDICAMVCEDPDAPGTYVVLVFQRGHYDNVFAFILKTNDVDDITKLLNGYKITRSILG
ncbi:MAG: hypothetical protein IJZ76_01525 [Lachnospiraceae bacterium]|nr:hypothetical protein [Lachnospiraceae bacterium]